jgi:hypothetical protein
MGYGRFWWWGPATGGMITGLDVLPVRLFVHDERPD